MQTRRGQTKQVRVEGEGGEGVDLFIFEYRLETGSQLLFQNYLRPHVINERALTSTRSNPNLYICQFLHAPLLHIKVAVPQNSM